jgi:hypothetical protein
MPIFPELYPLLLDGFEMASDGQEYIINRYRSNGQNLRTRAHRIIRRAGIEPWPKTFQNLRSSRETELAESYPIQVVTSWLGNTPEIAAKHYLQTTDEHFRKAVQDPVQNLHAGARVGLQQPRTSDSQRAQLTAAQRNATPCNDKELQSIPPRGLEPLRHIAHMA